MLRKLDAGGTFAGAYLYPLHTWRLGKDVLQKLFLGRSYSHFMRCSRCTNRSAPAMPLTLRASVSQSTG